MDKKNEKAMRRVENDSGVSPVVGVMLMLVVTIIVAAIVAAFAGGLGDSAEKSPTSTIDVALYRGNSQTAVINNVAGDSLYTNELFITVSYTLPLSYGGNDLAHGGETITHSIDGRLLPINDNDLDETLTGYPFVYQTTNNNATVSKRVSGQEKFGDAVLVSGSQIAFDLSYFTGFDVKQTNIYGINGASKFHVTITHKPSNTVIFDKDVRVSS